MSRNGAGVYTLPAGSTVTNGDTSDATDLNTPLFDLETDMNTPRPVVAGGTGASSASAARTALGLAIGSDVQAYDAGLASIAGLTTAANKMIYTTASDVYAVTDLTAAGRAILDDADASAQRTTLGLAIGTDVQAYDADLAAIAALADPNADRILFWDDSAGSFAFASVSGLAFSGTTLGPTGMTYLGSQSVTNDATGIVTGLSAYRRLWVVGVGLDQVSGGALRFRVGDSGGAITGSVYKDANGGSNTSFEMSDGTTGARGFSICIENFNTTDAVKAVAYSGKEPDAIPILIDSASAFDRFSVFSDAGANNVTAGTLYWWGE